MALQPIARGDASEEVHRFFSPDVVERIQRPTEQATGLPNDAYTSAEFLEIENRLLFTRTWMCAGFAHDIPNSGDVMPVELAGVPLILVRARAGEIRAFHNVCRHRGTQLVSERLERTSALSCPYHGWTYDLDGRLTRRAHFDGPGRDSSCAEISLFPVRCDRWEDLVFVNLNGEAPDFDEFMQPLKRQVDAYDLSTLRYAGEMTWEIRSNWKLIHENFIEPYHVPWNHPELEKWEPAASHRLSFDGPCFVNYSEFDPAQAGFGAGLPHLPHLSNELACRGTILHLFPSFGLNIYPEQMAVFHLTPLAPNRTFERILFYLPEEAMSAEHADGRKAVFDVMGKINDEDIGILERQQKGRSSPAFEGGLLSPYWDAPTTHRFARLVVEGMLS